MRNTSLTESVPSLAVTFTDNCPTSVVAGVPEKFRFAASKVSQVGSGLPSFRVAS